MSIENLPEVEADSVESGPSQEEANVAAQSESTEEASAEADGPSKEEWVIPGRYKSVDDLRNAYKHLEAEYSRRGNELHSLRNTIGHTSAHTQPSVDPGRRIEQFAEDVKRDPVQAIEKIAKSVAEPAYEEVKRLRMEAAYNELKKSSDFGELEPIMVNLAQQYEDMIHANGLQNDPRLLNILYMAAKGQHKDTMAKSAESRGMARGEAAALKKTKAQVESVSGTKGHVKRNFEELSLEEMEKVLKSGTI